MAFMTSFLTKDELEAMGFKKYGENVLISRYARFYHPERISIGNHTRIDDFCVFSAGSNIIIGDYNHIGCYVSMIGQGDIILDDYCSISGRVSFYSSSDDYTGLAMSNPTIPSQFTYVKSGIIHLHKSCMVGCGCVILPKVSLFEGASISAMSLVVKDCDPDSVYSGIPAKKVANKLQRYHKIVKQFEEWRKEND